MSQPTEFARIVGYHLVDTGMNKKEFSEFLGCHPSTLTRALDGTGNIPVEWLPKLPPRMAAIVIDAEIKKHQQEIDKFNIHKSQLARAAAAPAQV